MAFSTNSPAGLSSEINVTPLIDVLLVLLVIFMIIVPLAPQGLTTEIPQPPKSTTPEAPPRTIVVQVRANGQHEASYLINETPFLKSQLKDELVSIFSTRQERVMFIKADAALEYSQVAEVIDFGHLANVDNIGLITPHMEAAQ